ncbi:hypothetical protein T4D_7370 [Trichinella pseudospiralis]|uniref:Uncharacterized protein n=1 Tax=Trichinella pseudospiralis TaxID=6337 RepID=A0A0V1FE40_TRIPS|nr:hypothetical protein T4D_4989 [Trichinella pseudospiralis]KRY85926.1 hypothetical protein T4D_7370 [Trichinella pseudospiralis]
MEFSTCFYGERLKSTLMLNRGIRRLYMVALGADTGYRSFYHGSQMGYSDTENRLLNGRRGILSLSPRVTVTEYCIIRLGGYTKLGTSRSLKMESFARGIARG